MVSMFERVCEGLESWVIVNGVERFSGLKGLEALESLEPFKPYKLQSLGIP